MQSYLKKAWAVIADKIGALASFIIPVAKELHIAIAAGDIPGIIAKCDALDARFDELDETTVAGREITAHVRKSVADGELDAVEAAHGLLLVERFADEFEDVFTGTDEDDPLDAVPTDAVSRSDDGPQDDPHDLGQPS